MPFLSHTKSPVTITLECSGPGPGWSIRGPASGHALKYFDIRHPAHVDHGAPEFDS